MSEQTWNDVCRPTERMRYPADGDGSARFAAGRGRERVTPLRSPCRAFLFQCYRELAATRAPSATSTVPLTASRRRRIRGRRNQSDARPTAVARQT